MYIHKQKDLHFLMAIHFLAVLKADVKLNCIAKGKDFFFPPSKPSSRGNQYNCFFKKTKHYTNHFSCG